MQCQVTCYGCLIHLSTGQKLSLCRRKSIRERATGHNDSTKQSTDRTVLCFDSEPDDRVTVANSQIVIDTVLTLLLAHAVNMRGFHPCL